MVFVWHWFWVREICITHPKFIHVTMSRGENVVSCTYSHLQKKSMKPSGTFCWISYCEIIFLTHIDDIHCEFMIITVNWQLFESLGQVVSDPPVLRQARRPSKILWKIIITLTAVMFIIMTIAIIFVMQNLKSLAPLILGRYCLPLLQVPHVSLPFCNG